jgi:hypothetical protein
MDGKRWNGYLYEDLYIGMEFLSPGRTITDADLVGFAGLTGDFLNCTPVTFTLKVASLAVESPMAC